MRLVILGLQGSGKTYLTKHAIIPEYEDQYIVFDPNDEYAGYKRYIPRFTDSKEESKKELALFLKKVVIPNTQSLEDISKGKKPKKKRLRAVIFDEADLIAPSKSGIPLPLRSLAVKSRHLQLDIIFIARRPTDLNAYLMDTADYLAVYKQVGYNALKTMRALKIDSDKQIKALDYAKHEYLLFDREREAKQLNLEDFPVDILTERCIDE